MGWETAPSTRDPDELEKMAARGTCTDRKKFKVCGKPAVCIATSKSGLNFVLCDECMTAVSKVFLGGVCSWVFTKITPKASVKKCTCDLMTLMRSGCKCGGV